MHEKIFISGAAGVIGRQLVKIASDKGHEIFAGDLKPRPTEFPSDIHYWQGDLNHLTVTELEKFNPSIYIHLAATFERSIESENFYFDNFENNVKLSHHLLTISNQLKTVKRRIFASSYLVYNPKLYLFDEPTPKSVGLSENDETDPRNLIGSAKYFHEKEMAFFDRLKKQNSNLNVRIYRGYGLNSRDVISRWVRMLLQGEELEVFNSEGKFDFIYCKDSAEGLYRLALSDVTGIINLGSGRSRSIQEVIDVLKKHFPDMKLKSITSDTGYESSEANISLLQENIGWKPIYDLETAIPEIIYYEKSKAVSPTPNIGNLLVTSASRKVTIINMAKKALATLNPSSKVIAGDSDENVITKYLADDFWQMPILEDHGLERLSEAMRARGIASVVPTRDGELKFWAKHKNSLAADGIAVMVSDPETIDICQDKLRFAHTLQSLGFPTIATFTDPANVVGELFVAKPRLGSGSVGIHLGITPERAAILFQESKEGELVFQEYVTGMEFSADVWVSPELNEAAVVLRTRDRVKNGESEITTIFRNTELETLIRKLALNLKITGPAVIQGFILDDNSVKIIECNPRLGGASSASFHAGLRQIQWNLQSQYDLLNVGDVREFTPQHLRMVRFPADHVIYDFDL